MSGLDLRINEAKSLGFKNVIAPNSNVKRLKGPGKSIDIIGISNVVEVFQKLF